jgi:hypothetical protein
MVKAIAGAVLIYAAYCALLFCAAASDLPRYMIPSSAA